VKQRAIHLVVVLAVVVGVAVVVLIRLDVVTIGESPSNWPVPDPDTSAMEPRVQQLLHDRRQAVLDASSSAQAWGELAIACDAHGLVPEAVQAYERAAALEPEDFRWAYFLALKRIQEDGSPSEGLRLLERAAQLRPDYAPVHVRIGLAHASDADPSAARAAYDKSLQIDPTRATAGRHLGQLLLASGQTEQALRELEEAQRLIPDDRAVATGLGQCYLRLGDASRAQHWAHKVASFDAKIDLVDPVRDEVEEAGVSTRLLSERAQKLMARGQFENAARILMQVAERYPDDAAVQLHLGACYQESKLPDQAIAHLVNALRLKSDLTDAHRRLAQLWWDRGDFTKVAFHYRQIIKLGPPDSEDHTSLAIALANSGDFRSAIAEFKKAIELAPQQADKHSDLGTALLRQGDAKTAISCFEQALSLDPDYAVAHFNIATAYEQLGQIDRALEHYRKAYKLDPKSPAARKLVELTNKGT
jgi:tetratricopeptide (TPR) repeat protein